MLSHKSVSENLARPPRLVPPERVRTRTMRPKKPPRPQSPRKTNTSPKASSAVSSQAHHFDANSRVNSSPKSERSLPSNSQSQSSPPRSSRRSVSRPPMSSPRPRHRHPKPRKALSPKPRRLKHSARQVYHKLTRSSTHTPPNIHEALTQGASPLPMNSDVGSDRDAAESNPKSHHSQSSSNGHQSSANDSLYHVSAEPKMGNRAPVPSLAVSRGVVRGAGSKVADVTRKYTYCWKATASHERRESRVDWPSSDSIKGLRKSCADKEPRVMHMIELYEHLQGSRSDLSSTEDPLDTE